MSIPAGNRAFAQRLIYKIECVFSYHKLQLMGQKALKLTVVKNQLLLRSLHLLYITILSGEATEDWICTAAATNGKKENSSVRSSFPSTAPMQFYQPHRHLFPALFQVCRWSPKAWLALGMYHITNRCVYSNALNRPKKASGPFRHGGYSKKEARRPKILQVPILSPRWKCLKIIQLVMNENTLTIPGKKKDSRKKGQLFTCCRDRKFPCKKFQTSLPTRLFFFGGREAGKGGNVASGCECMCEGVQSSLHKPPASSAEERRLVLTDMLQSQQSLQENSSSSAGLICSPCPWCSLGDCQGSQPSSQSSFDWVGWE